MWYLPGPGIEPESPALAGGFFTIRPPRKPSQAPFRQLVSPTPLPWSFPRAPWESQCLPHFWEVIYGLQSTFHTVPKYLLPTCLKYRQSRYYYPPFADGKLPREIKWFAQGLVGAICTQIPPWSRSLVFFLSFSFFYIFYIGMSHKYIFVADD